jgi:putative membrane protein
VLIQWAGVRGSARHVLPALVVVSLSGLYELIEWAAASAFDPELGVAYVGAQGDVWDAQKDMALAAVGAVTSTVVIALGERRPDAPAGGYP